MKSSIKRFFLALGAATMMVSAPVAAQASGDDSTVCDTCDADGLISALNNIVIEITQLQLLQDVSVDDVYLVDVDDALNGDVIDILTFNKSLNKNYLNVILLKSVLSDFTVIDNDGTLIEIEDFLNDNMVELDDVVAVDVLNGNDIVIFHD